MKEALKLAQKALSNRNAPAKTIYEALHAIKEALAQSEPEPEVRYFEQWQGQPIEEIDEARFNQVPEEYRFRLYTTPPQPTWVGLTDEDLRELGFETRPRWWPTLEAKLKEKNT